MVSSRHTAVRRSATILVLFATLAAILALAPLPAALAGRAGEPVGQAASSEYTGLDLVLLVDQSGSMGGLTYGSSDHPKANDKNDLRFVAAQWLVDWAGSWRLAYGVNHNLDIRAAVIDFGDTTNVRMASIRIAPQSEEEWEMRLQELQQSLSADAFGKRNLGNTNPLLAFQAARRAFDEMEKANPGEKRIKAIFLVTDGIPYVVRPPDPKAPTPTPVPAGQPTPSPTPVRPIPAREYMPGVINYVKTNFPSPEYQVFVIGMNDSERDQWTPMEPYWQQASNNHAYLNANNAQMGATLNELVFELSKPLGLQGGRVPCGQQVIPPYLKLVRFTVHKANSGDRVELQVNNIEVPLPNPPNVRVQGLALPIEVIEVGNPEPGYWNLICSTGGVLDPVIYEERYFVEPTLINPIGRKLQSLPAPIQLKLVGDRGADLPEYTDPKYQLTVTAQVNGPKGSETLSLTPDINGLYTAPYVPQEPGKYQIKIIGTTQDPEGNPITIVEKTIPETFTVSATKPRVIDMPATDVLKPTTIKFEITDDAGQRIQAETLRSLGEGMAVVVTEADGPRESPVTIGQDGTLTASIVPLQAGDLPLSLAATGTGGGASLLNASLGTLKVSPLNVKLLNLADAQAQYKTLPLAIEVTNAAGARVAPPADIPLDVTATLSGAANASVALSMSEPGVWSQSFRPDTAGNIAVHATLTARLPGGAERVVFDGDAGAFTVTPTTKVGLAIVAPKNGSESEYNKFIPFLKNPFTMLIELRAGDQTADPTNVLTNAGETPFKVSLVDAKGQERGGELTIASAGQAGRWRLTSESLTGRDTYKVTVTGAGNLKPAFVWDEAPQSIAVTRIPNRLLPVTYAVTVALVLLILYLFGRWIANHFILQKAAGILQIEDTNGQRIGTPCNLNSLKVHSYSWRPGIQTGIKRVQVTGVKNGVSIRIVYAKGGGVTHKLTGTGKKPLTGGNWVSYQGAYQANARGQVAW